MSSDAVRVPLSNHRRRWRVPLLLALAFGVVLNACGSTNPTESMVSEGSSPIETSVPVGPRASKSGTVLKGVVARPVPRECPFANTQVWDYWIVEADVVWVSTTIGVVGEDLLDSNGRTEYVGDLEIVSDGQLGQLDNSDLPFGQVWDGSRAVFHASDLEVDFHSRSLVPCGLIQP
jgi:hypothetical protein